MSIEASQKLKGFRVFVPLLAVNIGTRALDADGQPRIELAGGFDWLSSDIALMVFLVATLFEIGGYYIPWIDNLLDTIASPASIVAGTVITASFVTGMDPWLQWLLGVIAGHDPRDPYSSRTPTQDFTADLATGIDGIRIGIPREYFFDVIDPEVEEATRQAARVLEGLGASVDEVSMPVLEHSLAISGTIMLAEAAEIHLDSL